MRMNPSEDIEIPLRLIVLRPPDGVAFCLQSGRDELVNRIISTGEDIVFDLSVRARRMDGDASPRILGPFAQGPPASRFIYVCSGTSAGQADSCWTRRAKISLSGLTWPMIEALRDRDTRIEARFLGTGKDGGPSCATVRLLDGGWKVTR